MKLNISNTLGDSNIEEAFFINDLMLITKNIQTNMPSIDASFYFVVCFNSTAILVTVEPLIGSLIGIFIWKENIDVVKLVGIVMIFIAVILINMNCKSQE